MNELFVKREVITQLNDMSMSDLTNSTYHWTEERQ